MISEGLISKGLVSEGLVSEGLVSEGLIASALSLAYMLRCCIDVLSLSLSLCHWQSAVLSKSFTYVSADSTGVCSTDRRPL